MGRNTEDVNHLTDLNLGTSGIFHRLSSESFSDLSPTEMADLRDNAGTQSAFDAWWASRPTPEANWYAARTTAWKAGARTLVLLLET